MKRIFCFLLAVFMMTGVVLGSGMTTEYVFADDGCSQSFLGMRPWFSGLPMGNNCSIMAPSEAEMPKFIWTIVLNVLYDLSLVVGVITTGFIIYGGYVYITAEGDRSKAEKAKKTISAAIIGLIIALAATVIINTITAVLLGS